MDPRPHETPRLLALGDAAWTLEFGDGISAALNARVMALADQVTAARGADPLWAGVTDVVPTFRSLTVHFDPLRTDAAALAQQLQALGREAGHGERQGCRWRLPVCFDEEFAPDLARLADTKGITPDDVVARLLAAEFRVYMIGFLPGLPYMGGLPPELALPRLASPRVRVPRHSVAVAGEMCTVYPWDSPGGWNLLGRTPAPLFDLQHPRQSAMLAAGDRVRWRAVTRDDYERLLAEGERGALPREAFAEPEATP